MISRMYHFKLFVVKRSDKRSDCMSGPCQVGVFLRANSLRQRFATEVIVCDTVIKTCFMEFLGDLVSVYEQEITTDTYLGASALPAMSAFTICMWFYGVADHDDSRTEDYFVNLYHEGTM